MRLPITSLILALLAGCEPALLEEPDQQLAREPTGWKVPPPAADDLQPGAPPPTNFPGGQPGVSPQSHPMSCGAVATVNATRFVKRDSRLLDDVDVAAWSGVWTWLPGGIYRWGASTAAVARALQRAADQVGDVEVERIDLGPLDHESRWQRLRTELEAGHAVALVIRCGPKNAHWIVLHQLHREGDREFAGIAHMATLGWMEKGHLLQELFYNSEGQWWGDGQYVVVARRSGT
jgi:hypothetical protein